ncbi:MAG: NADH-quinone oxidoreductase subunit NuoB [Gemmatimonadota bacterium]
MGILSDIIVNWSRRHGLRPLAFGTTCCAGELDAALGPRFAAAMPSGLTPTSVVAHADLLVAAGRISQKMAPVLRQTYEAMAWPRWVVAFGACSCSGGAFSTYATVQGLERVVPVDVYVPGCPPRPEDLAEALAALASRLSAARGAS